MKITKKRFQKLAGVLKENLEQEEPAPREEQKKIFVLVGPPSVGKSTWVASMFDSPPYVINRDELVESIAGALGWTYDDMFASPPQDAVKGEVDEKYGEVVTAPKWMSWTPTAFSKVLAANAEVQNQFNSRVQGATGSGQNIVVDMTNMTPKARQRALQAIGGGKEYKKVAVVFEFEGAEDMVQKVAQKRAEAAQRMGKSKTIPPHVFSNMFKSFSRPTKSEGFDEIVSVDNRELLKRLANEPLEENPKHRFMNLAGLKESDNDKIDFDVETRMKEPDISMEAIEKLCKAKMIEILEIALKRAKADADQIGDDSVHYGIIILQTELEELLGVE